MASPGPNQYIQASHWQPPVSDQHRLNVGAGNLMRAGIVDGTGVVKSPMPDEIRETSSNTASRTSASGIFSASSTTSATSAATSLSTSKSSSSSSTAFSSSQSGQSSGTPLSIGVNCANPRLEGTYLHLDCLSSKGTTIHSAMDLDEIIGFDAGRLKWGMKGFSKHCFNIRLEGFILYFNYRSEDGSSQNAHFDLQLRLRNEDGKLVFTKDAEDAFVMLSEVPWLKLRVSAEPDINVFIKHPIMQRTLVDIAEATVEHVTAEMNEKLALATREVVATVTASAMKYVSSQMETWVQKAIGRASDNSSIRAAGLLQLYAHLQAEGGGVGLPYANGVGISSVPQYRQTSEYQPIAEGTPGYPRRS